MPKSEGGIWYRVITPEGAETDLTCTPEQLPEWLNKGYKLVEPQKTEVAVDVASEGTAASAGKRK